MLLQNLNATGKGFKFNKKALTPIDPSKNKLLNLEVSADFDEDDMSDSENDSESNEYGNSLNKRSSVFQMSSK